MPLFMFISGYTVFISKGYSRKPALFLKTRFIQLLLPFITWSLLLAVKALSPGYIMKILVQPDYGLWFLWVLFYVAMIHYIIYYNIKDNRLILFVIVMSYFLLRGISSITNDVFGTRLIATHLVYYSLGYAISSIIKNAPPSQLRVWMTISLLIYVLIFIPFRWGSPIISIPSIPKIGNDLLDTLIKMVMSSSACIFILFLFKMAGGVLENHVIKVIGRETLGIYVSHFCIIAFMRDLHLDGNIVAAISIVAGLLTISHITICLIKKSYLLSFYMLGIQKH